VDKQVLVVVTKEVQVEILELQMEIVDLAMWSSKLMDLLMYSSYKVPAGVY
jgi:hypothetical protein